MLSILTILLSALFAVGPQPDTTQIYADRKDTLSAAAVSTGQGNYTSRYREIKTEVISAAGLCKMACCNLAESFENSASVTVGYSDAVTGARQIRLLGLSGIYTQMLDENRPVMRGIAAPFGLGYVPGQWLSSIQIAKGAPSVINGVESITGQINMEHRKPTDEIPLFVNASFMSDLKADLNVASSLQLDPQGRWSTVILGHVSGNFKDHDLNGDGFLDEPRQTVVNLSNRWLYYGPDGTQLRFGVRFLRDSRTGGQKSDAAVAEPWRTDILNQSFNAYLKLGVPLNDDNTRNIALVTDFNDYSMNSSFSRTVYNASQISGFANVLYQDQSLEAHHFTLGLSATYDRFKELFDRQAPLSSWKTDSPLVADLINAGAFGEYTFRCQDRLTAIAGLRADWFKGDGFRFSPRVTVKYTPLEQIVLRVNAGRGLRHASSLADNIGVLSTSKSLFSNGSVPKDRPLFVSHPLEDAWIAGASASVYLPFGASDQTCLSFDYFRTQFVRQLIADHEHYTDVIDFYMLDGQSFTDTYQLDFSVEPVRRFTVTTTFRYTDAKVSLAGRGLVERPMTSRYKGVLNLQYATNLNKWIFDFTASINGPCRVYDFMKDRYPSLHSPAYPLLYAQVTHRMRGWDIYIGGENLTNFTQKDPIIGASNPYGRSFDASCIWGPIMGIKIYGGVRITIWK